ncbi:MAG: hypothetical protein MUF23_06930 [Pirellula sp.]|jgi:hypothetical protein|nr:hypothetical protein [Pirellula sp.]
MTLIEVLIATALTLVIMLALAQGFKTLSQGVTAGRARLTGSDQLRGLSSLLRADLSGLTANIRQLPQTQQAANGYFMYYDGPLSDSTAMLFNYVPGAPTNEEKLSASRWSDIDDVLMFTAKAKDGQWFRGRVPLALLKIHQRNITGNNAIQPTLQDWLTDVSVASEYAEIAWFMRPLNDLGSVNVGETGGGYGFTPPASPVIDTAPGVDRTGDGIPDPDGMPDRVALCRRVFLIRPDLDITADPGVNLPSDQQLAAQPLDVDTSNIDSFRYQMRFVYQRCDLSVRPLLDATRGAFVLRTNSLADLQIPENRFAHHVVPVDLNIPSSDPIGPATTLPHLALTSEGEPSAANYLSMITLAYGTGILPIDRGFIPAAFFRTKIDADSNGNIISARPTLEEVVASNVVGFDVRGYDGMVQQLASPGVDGIWGINNVVAEAGLPGTDDLVVSPSDPGYAFQIGANVLVPQNSGAFVDLGWGRRVVNQVENATLTQTLGGMTYFSSIPNAHRALWSTPLSGFDPLTGGGPVNTLSTMQLAGRFNPIASVYQPTFDTFTDAYEADGNRQLAGFSANGLVRFGGSASTNNPEPDQGIDGLDNNNNGAVDEELEQETRPPFVYEMPSIQIKFRIQDVPAGTLQELSIVHDLTGK